MNNAINYADLFYHATEINKTLLEKNVKDYPASSVAQFLLLYDKKKNNDPDLDNSLKQIGMYLTNPCWIQYQLLRTGAINDQTLAENNIASALSAKEEKIDEKILKPENYAIAETSAEEKNLEIEINTQPEQNEKRAECTSDKNDNTKEVVENSQEQIKHQQSANNIKDLIVPQLEVILENSHEDLTHDEAQKEPIQIIDEETSVVHSSDTVTEPLPNEIQETETALPAKEGDIKSSPETIDDSIAFEPLHTVDYFASQGIKISEEALGNDQLGKQVKSFTAWLKSMKKLHPGQMPEQNEVIEKIIQSSSEASNNEANILTEAMAEVLVMQDKKEKAIEMYEKLSLINPSKSAYFAAKIESLKTI